jgi:hypothetical protein
MRPTRRSTKIHAASLGEFAPDAAVREQRVEVVLVDEDGRREGYGRLVERRRVGDYLVELADDGVRGMWWVVAVRLDPPRQVLAGFRRERRADARDAFDHVTEGELDREPWQPPREATLCRVLPATRMRTRSIGGQQSVIERDPPATRHPSIVR